MFVFSNLAISLDGKIATKSRQHFPLGTEEDRRMMHVLRRRCDAIVMGAETLRMFKAPCFARGSIEQPLNVVLSSTLEGISPSWPFFMEKSIRRLLFVTQEVSKRRLDAFRDTSEVISLNNTNKGKNRNSIAKQVLNELDERGIQKILLEGGGNLMWNFVHENLIDEYHVTLTPKLIGGTESPTLVDGEGFDPKEILNLKLASCRKRGHEVYLVYKR